MGQTMERMKEGYSKIRNEALAHAFAYMNLIEHWGSGIPRIIDKVKAAGLQEPEFIGGEVDLRINIYRGQVDTNSAIINANDTKNGANGVNCGADDGTNGAEVPLNKEQMQIEKLLQIIEKNPSATQAYYAEKMGISKRTVSRMFASLQEKGRLVQGGTKRKANWKIIRYEDSMDTDKIIQDLNRRFAAPLPEFYQRRIIFWYDEDKEFEDKLDEVVLENAKVIALTGNNVFCRNLYEARRTNEYVQS